MTLLDAVRGKLSRHSTYTAQCTQPVLGDTEEVHHQKFRPGFREWPSTITLHVKVVVAAWCTDSASDKTGAFQALRSAGQSPCTDGAGARGRHSPAPP